MEAIEKTAPNSKRISFEEIRIHNDLLYYFLKTVMKKESQKIKEKYQDIDKRLISVDLEIKFHRLFPIKHEGNKIIRECKPTIYIIGTLKNENQMEIDEEEEEDSDANSGVEILHEFRECEKDLLIINFLLSIERNSNYNIYFKHTSYDTIKKTTTCSGYYKPEILLGNYVHLYRDFKDIKPQEPRIKKKPGRRKNSEKQKEVANKT